MTYAVNIAQGGSNNVTMRNRIINGAMMIDQRNAGASVANNAGSIYTVDRWQANSTQASKFTIQQNAGSVTPPLGFTNYAGCVSSSAYSVISTDYFFFEQRVEGFNTADLAWGSASAVSVTVSFWVRSSLTGTFGGSLRNSASNYNYPFTYTISQANTWTFVTLTIAGPTSGTWFTNSSTGIIVAFSLGTGSSTSATPGVWNSTTGYGPTGATSVVGTSGATFYVTGVQLEAGTTATPFEQRLYGQELALCQRYLPCFNSNSTGYKVGIGFAGSTTQSYVYYQFPVTTRVPPTGISVSAVANFTVNPYSGTGGVASSISFVDAGTQECRIQANSTGLVAGTGVELTANTSSATQIQFTGCEL